MTERSPSTEPTQPLKQLLAWQRKLLPFTIGFLIAIVIGFFALSLFGANEMQKFVKNETEKEVRKTVEDLIRAHELTNPATRPTDMIWESLLVLEADSIDKRYRHASALLLSRIWTRQLAFITGMVLAF